MSLERLQRAGHQSGWLMPVAAFIIVVMAALAVAMGRIGSQSSLSVVQEQVSLQAFYVAESGAQLAMTSLTYPEADPALAMNACSTLDGSIRNLAAPGMESCRVMLSCNSVVDNGLHLFTIISEGECGTANLRARRRIEVATVLE